jgi:GT2 family glycosyltransferase
MKFQPDLLIVILNWNSSADTRRCIDSLLPQLKAGHGILVVDNGSTDDSVVVLHRLFPKIEIIKNTHNLGFQGGMNVGIREALARRVARVMLLNCDTIASPTMLDTLLTAWPADAAVISPGIYYASHHDKLCSTGGSINPILLEMLHQKSLDQSQSPVHFEFLPSHAWLIDTSIFPQVGLLDEMFFPLYYDDLDFCLRLKQNGFHLYLLPKAKLYHSVSLSVGGRNSPRERFLMARNSGYYFRKHMRIWQVPIIFLFRTGSGLLWTIRLLASGNLTAVRHYWDGFRVGWFGKMPVSKTD